MLVDRAVIEVRSGKGGNGCVSFRREKFVPKGGPDGGDGGNGASIILKAAHEVDSLAQVGRRHAWHAPDGGPGRPAQCHGADGTNLTLMVPPGTLVFDDQDQTLLADLDAAGKHFTAARGGRGGFGNEHFKSATHQAPVEATPGEAAEDRTLRLELKLIADIGLIGLPNAGKSTLLSVISAAHPKVADYPFTTLQPHLGIAELPDEAGGGRRLIVADIPGLIEGASTGRGLGHEFLRHIERTRLLIHLVAFDPDADLAEQHAVVRRELDAYSAALASKPQIVALSKADLMPDPSQEAEARRRLEASADGPVFTISAATRRGVRELLEASWQKLAPSQRDAPGWGGPAASSRT